MKANAKNPRIKLPAFSRERPIQIIKRITIITD